MDKYRILDLLHSCMVNYPKLPSADSENISKILVNYYRYRLMTYQKHFQMILDFQRLLTIRVQGNE